MATEQRPESIVSIERAILSRILRSPEQGFQLLGYLQGKHFAVTQHQAIFGVIESLIESGSEPTTLIVISKLESTGQLEKAGGREYVEELFELNSQEEDLRSLSDIVIKNYMLRSANAIGHTLTRLEKSDRDTIESYLSQVSHQIDELVVGGSGSYTEHINSLLREDWEDLKLRIGSPGVTGVPTGFSDLDMMVSGLNKGDLMIVAARPSTGKSAVLLRVALNMAKNNVPVLIFSYEMSKKQLSQRMISMETGINLLDIKHGSINESQLETIKTLHQTISNYPIYIDSNMTASLGYILSTIRRYVRTSGVQTVFIDYVQLMVQNSDNETQELGRISRALKLLAGELGISIVLLSQLNRGLESRESKRPMMSDLRQSGRLEEDADVIIMLYRPAAYGKVKDDEEYLLELIIRKNRNGPIGIVQTYFHSESVNIFNTLSELTTALRTKK